MRPYTRNFITLKQERSDYSFNSRKCLGRCIIEAKGDSGKISFYVQDLKPQTIYKLYMISCTSKQSVGVPLGTINVDHKGKAEGRFEFNADSVGGSNIAVEGFNVIAVMVPVKNDIVAPLVGYVDNIVIWKTNYQDTSLDEHVLSTMEEVTEVEEHPAEEVAVDEVVVENVLLEKIPVEDAPVEEPPPVQETPVQETPAVDTSHEEMPPKETPQEDLREITLEAAHLAFKDIIHKYNEEIALLENYSFDIDENEVCNYKSEPVNTHNDLSMLYTSNKQAFPFDKVFQDVKWIEITIKELVFFNDKYFTYMYNSFVLHSYHKYRHLILGCKSKETDQYILGIPSAFYEDDAATAKGLGFKHFISCDGNDTAEGAFGYWLLYI